MAFWGRSAATLAASCSLTAGLIAAGCGSSSDQSSPTTQAGEQIDLVRFLLPGADYYETADLAAIRRGLGLPEDADPLRGKLGGFGNQLAGGLFSANLEHAVLAALDPPSWSEMAFSNKGDPTPVTAIRTEGDASEIEAKLLDLGFVDRDGVLEGPDGGRATGDIDSGGPFTHHPLAVRFIGDDVFASTDAAALRELPSVPGDLPLDVQTKLRGDATLAFRPMRCMLGSGVSTNADGSAELVYVIDGRPDPSAFSSVGTDVFSDPEVNGNVLTVEVKADQPLSPQDLLAEYLPGYACT